jgi:hypothetical protein
VGGGDQTIDHMTADRTPSSCHHDRANHRHPIVAFDAWPGNHTRRFWCGPTCPEPHLSAVITTGSTPPRTCDDGPTARRNPAPSASVRSTAGRHRAATGSLSPGVLGGGPAEGPRSPPLPDASADGVLTP